MSYSSRRSWRLLGLTLGFTALVGIAAVFCPAGEFPPQTQPPGGENGLAKSAEGQEKSISPVPGLQDAYRLEALDMLEEALAVLPVDKVEGEVKKHRDLLLKMLASKKAADEYKTLGHPERARQTFEEKRPKETDLDPIRDAPLFGVLARLRDKYDAAAAGPAIELAKGKLAKADVLRRTGSYAQAATLYRDVATANATPSATSVPLPETLVKQARTGAIESDLEDAASKSLLTHQGRDAQVWGVFVELVTALGTALRYVVFFAVALGLFILLVRFPDWRRARTEVVLDLKDLVSSAGGKAGSEPVGGADRALMHDFMMAIQSLALNSNGLGAVVLSRDTDSQAFADLRVVDNDLTKEFEQLITGTEPVKLGPVSFSPRELFDLLRRAFEKPPVLTLSGSLSRPPSDGPAGVNDGRVSLCVVGLLRGRAILGGQPSPFPKTSAWPPSTRRWDATHSGPGARDRVVREVAASFVFHTIKAPPQNKSMAVEPDTSNPNPLTEEKSSTQSDQAPKTIVTLDWPSFRDYHEAIYLNSLEDPVAPPPTGAAEQPAGKAEDPARDRMIRAAALLQSSVRHDPTNWLAAFYFGDVLRRLGRNAAAARVFGGLRLRIHHAMELKKPAPEDDDEPLRRLRAFLDQRDYSDFEAVVTYNEAVSLSKTNDRTKNLSAIETLCHLVQTSQDSKTFDPTLKAVLSLSGVSRTEGAARALAPSVLSFAGGSRLALLSLSALASALLVEYEQLRYRPEGRRNAVRRVDNTVEKPGETEEQAKMTGERAAQDESNAHKQTPERAEAAEFARQAAVLARKAGDDARRTADKAKKAHDGAIKVSDKGADRLQKRRETVFAAIMAIDDELHNYDNKPRIDRATFNIARGLARNALGRAFYIEHLYDSAYEALTDATELLPDFAEAYVNLASVCLVDPGARKGWLFEAEGHLATALRLNSASSKANYLMGKFCVRLGLGRLAEAKTHFEAAGRDIWADRALARFYADLLEPPDLRKALEWLQSSLSLFPTPDSRSIDFLVYITRLAPSDLTNERFKRSLCKTIAKIRPDRMKPESRRIKTRTLLAQVTQLLGCSGPPTTEVAGGHEPAAPGETEPQGIPTPPQAQPPKTDRQTDTLVTLPIDNGSKDSNAQ